MATTNTKPTATKKRKFSFAAIGKFFKEVVAELKRVSWPERKDLISYTVAVIVFVLIMAVVTGALDLGFGYLAKLVVV